jgi:hypothetical protein
VCGAEIAKPLREGPPGFAVHSRTHGRLHGTRDADSLVAMLVRLGILALGGCAAATAGYVYTPRGANQWSDGYRTAALAVPSEAPTGSVELASFGVIEIIPRGAKPASALHVRMVVANADDDVPWTFDTGAQRVEFPAGLASRALFVNTDVANLPVVTLARGDRRVFDLYFEIPPAVIEEDDLESFDLIWQVSTPALRHESRTSFTRHDLTTRPRREVARVAGWGPHWWWNPTYPWPFYVVPPPILRHAYDVVVTRPPRGHR